MDTWSPERAARELLAVLPLLNRIVGSTVRRETGEETTMGQFRTLALLAAEPQTVSALARQRRISLQSMGTQVQALVERGWIERVPDPTDRRQALLQLTAEGKAQYAHTQSQTLARLTPLLAQLSAHELDTVAQALPALQRVLTEIPSPDEGGTT